MGNKLPSVDIDPLAVFILFINSQNYFLYFILINRKVKYNLYFFSIKFIDI